MSLNRLLGIGCHKRTGIRLVLALATLSSVLVARDRFPDFPHSASSQSTVKLLAHHDERPRFDYHGPRWTAPSVCFLSLPPLKETLRVSPRYKLYSTLQATGFHYNRPPPLS